MSLRNEIRRILKEELASLTNPLDKLQDKAKVDADAFKVNLDALKSRSDKEKKELEIDISAREKAKNVPQTRDASIERQRRNLADKEIENLKDKLARKKEDEEEMNDLEGGLMGLTRSLDDMDVQNMELNRALNSMEQQAGMQD